MAVKILIVDDQPLNIELCKDILTPEGYIVTSSENGEDALDKIFNNPPDLILLDVMMPGMNGYEVCRRIKQNKSLPYIPIIYITASEIEPKHLIEGLDSGGDDYIRKPFEINEFLQRIISCLRVKTLYDELAKTKAELSRYVSLSTRRMLDNKIQNDRAGSLDQDAFVTILFSDIRGFTQISEGMAPVDVFAKLNINIDVQLKAIEKYKGVVEKLNGDEVMAIFDGPGMGDNALGCALEIIKELSILGKNEKSEVFKVGIGINTGHIYLGSLGNELFKDYTVIGNDVNIAARLCGLADKFQVLFTETTLSSIHQDRFQFQSIGEKMLKGLSKPIEVFKISQ